MWLPLTAAKGLVFRLLILVCIPYHLAIRRSSSSKLYTANQVHLLPGYPSNASGSLQVAFYVQQPLGFFIGNISVLPRSTLAKIVLNHKSELETAIGANISDVEVLVKPATPTTSLTAGPVELSSNLWKWAAIGVGVGVVIIILIILIVFRWMKNKVPNVKRNHQRSEKDMPDFEEAWRSYNFYEL